MSLVRWLSIGIVAGLVWGCSPERPSEGGGGGAATAQSDEHAVLTRDYTGNAYMAAARAHRSLAQGNYRAARNDLTDVRRQLGFATGYASADQRRELERVVAKLGDVEAETIQHDPRAVVASRQLVEGLLWLFDSYAGFAPGGGGGPMASPRPKSVHEGPGVVY